MHIQPEKEQELDNLLKTALSKMSLGTDGKSVSVGMTNIHHVDAASYILAYHLDVPGIPEHNEQKIAILHAAIHDLVRQGKHSVQELQEVIRAKRQEYLAKLPQVFRIICPTNIDHSSVLGKKLSSFNVLKNRIDILGWPQVPSETISRFEKLLQFSDSAKNLIRTGVYLQTDARGRDQTEAFRVAEKSFSYFRGLLNLAGLHGIRTIRLGGGAPSPLSRFLPPPGYLVLDTGGRVVGEWRCGASLPWRTQCLDARDLKRSRELSRALREDRTTIRGMFTQAIRMYSEALDAAECSHQFLGLWQILEFMGRIKDRRATEKDVIRRIANMLTPEDFTRQLLTPIYDKRNKLVHRGSAELISNSDIGWLKLVVDSCIQFYFGHRAAFKSAHALDCYFEYKDFSSEELALRESVIRSVRRNRKPIAVSPQ